MGQRVRTDLHARTIQHPDLVIADLLFIWMVEGDVKGRFQPVRSKQFGDVQVCAVPVIPACCYDLRQGPLTSLFHRVPQAIRARVMCGINAHSARTLAAATGSAAAISAFEVR